jgi:hypothetical protein
MAATTYNEGVYGECNYQTGCETSSGVGAPDTGFLGQLSQPYILVPSILVGAILIATAILLIKKLIRRLKHQ